ncbi:MAG: hypothetical protein II574_01495, partial [Ruminococcus sp.]|nr:hypothetical protein [Ruminococcus sp.]
DTERDKTQNEKQQNKLKIGGNIKTRTKPTLLHKTPFYKIKFKLPQTHTFPIILLPQKRSDP